MLGKFVLGFLSAVRDINADGKLDALFGNGGDRPIVSVLLNQTR